MDRPDQHYSGNVYERRHVFDSKDTVPRELQYLQPLNASRDQATRIMVSPRRTVSAQDGSAQSAAASAVLMLQFSANDLVAGSWSPPPQGAGVLWESIRAMITTQDNSGKLQISVPVRIFTTSAFFFPLANFATPLPMTFPALIGTFYVINAMFPNPPWLPTDSAIPNGPLATIGMVNTDGAGAHTYLRSLAYTYRYIYDIDTSKEKVYVMGTLI